MAKNMNNQESINASVKRERSANFSMEERDILICLVIKYKDVIENKQSDVSTWKKKESAWAIIEKEFNARCGGHPRTSKTLRIKYEGLKRTVRKKCAALRSELYRTGGGKNLAVPLDLTEEKIKSLIQLSASGLISHYDSDVLPQTQDSQDGLEDVSMEQYIIIPEITTETEPHLNESCCILQEDIEKKEIENKVLPSIPLFEEGLASTSFISERQLMPMTFQQTTDMLSSDNENNGVTTPKTKKFGTFTPSLKWDVTSRSNLKTRKHPALQGTSLKKNVDRLTELKLELAELQIKLAEADLLEKRKEAAFREKQREWLEEEQKLKIQKLKNDLNQ